MPSDFVEKLQALDYSYFVKKIFLFIILVLFFSTSVNADWTIASNHENGTTEFYIDKDNVRKDRSTRYFWILMNLKDRKADRKHNSAIVYVQLDCKVLRGKDLKFISKSLEMGEGENVNEWQYPTPNSNMEMIYKRVCNL